MTNSDCKIVNVIQNSIQNTLSIKTKKSTAGGTSDARFFGQYKVPTVEFGVINDTIHSIDERTTVEEVEGLQGIFASVINDF
jgi:succinyl-diaminopimelate desuccinylase